MCKTYINPIELKEPTFVNGVCIMADEFTTQITKAVKPIKYPQLAKVSYDEYISEVTEYNELVSKYNLLRKELDSYSKNLTMLNEIPNVEINMFKITKRCEEITVQLERYKQLMGIFETNIKLNVKTILRILNTQGEFKYGS